MKDRDPSVPRRAVIDVGSNSVKLLVADILSGSLNPILECGEQTRLGRDSFETGRLQPKAIDDTIQVVSKFYKKAAKSGAETIRVVATSAARDASNGGDLIAAAMAKGVKLEIVSGDQETQWACRGALANPLVKSGNAFVVDVGGGSTEIILVRNKTILANRSFPMGTVRLLERSVLADPPGLEALEIERKKIQDWILKTVLSEFETATSQVSGEPLFLVGCGGTPVFLARIFSGTSKTDTEPVESIILSAQELEQTTERLWSLPLATRKKLRGLPPNRADVILFGALIFEGLMRCLNLSELQPSTWGVRHGAMLDSQ